jgi:hypothetical protein
MFEIIVKRQRHLSGNTMHRDDTQKLIGCMHAYIFIITIMSIIYYKWCMHVYIYVQWQVHVPFIHLSECAFSLAGCTAFSSGYSQVSPLIIPKSY